MADSESDSENDEVEMAEEEDHESNASGLENDQKDDSALEYSDSEGDGDVTTRFPFWKLPVLVRSIVTRLMKPAIVIHLSMHSRPFKKLLMAYKIPRVIFKFELRYRGKNYDKDPFGGCNIDLLLKFHDEKVIIHFACPYKTDTAMKPMKVGNEPMLIRHVSSRKFLFGNHMIYQEKLRDLEQLTRHFMEIFHVEKVNLWCEHTRDNHIFDCLIWKMVEKFDDIWIDEGLNRDEYDIEENEETSDEDYEEEEYHRLRIPSELTNEQLKFLLNTIKTDKLRISIDAFESDDFPRFQLKHRKIKLLYCSFLTIDDVMKAECEELSVLSLFRVEPKKVRDLVTKWQSGEILGNIKDLYFESNTEKEEVEKLFDNMSGAKRVSKQDQERLKKEGVSVNQTSWEVQRTTDGKTAVIMIYGRFDLKFSFIVLQSS